MNTGESRFDPWAPLEDDASRLYCDQRELMQGVMAHGITRRRAEIEKSGFAMLEAIEVCARYGLVIPDWLAAEYRRRFNAVKFYRASSWDDDLAFGRPHPKGAHLRSLRKDRLWPEICGLAERLQAEDPTRPIDEAFFDDLAERVRGLKEIESQRGLGRSEVQRIYYAHVDEYNKIFTAGNLQKSPVIRRR